MSASSAHPLIEMISVTRTFDGSPPLTALREVDLVVERGDYLAVVGPSGSGKSTLLNVLGCLDTVTSGQYLFDGADVASLDERQRSWLRGQCIGFVFQSFHLLPYRSAVDNVMLAEVYAGGTRRGRRQRAVEQLERVGLAHRRDELPTRLSGGERQRVAVARALMGGSHLLLCDEPTGALDSANTDLVLALLDQLHGEGLALVVITHDPRVATRAGRCVRISDGRLTEAAAV